MDDYYEDGLFFEYLEREFGEKGIQNLVQLIIEGSDYQSALSSLFEMDWSELQKRAYQYSSNRLNEFLKQSHYIHYKKIKKNLKEPNTDWAKNKISFENFIEQYPNSVLVSNAMYQLGRSNIKLKNYTQARKQFTELLVTHSHNLSLFKNSLYHKGVVLMKEGEKKQANEQFNQLLAIDPNSGLKKHIIKWIK